MPLPLKEGDNFSYHHFHGSYISDAPYEEILLKLTNAMISDLLKVMQTKSLDELLSGRRIIIHLEKSEQEKILQILDEYKERKKDDKLSLAIAFIQTHLAESPSLQETAEHIHISPSYLSKIFISRLHVSYSVFVLNEKIVYAQKLLVNSDDDMSKIAEKAGFSSNTYFSDCFKRITGMSPLQFRKAYRNA